MNALPAELIFYNGDFRTQEPGQERVRAIAVSGGQILAVGDDTAIMALSGPDTRKLDLGGRLGLPGFTDTHFHFYEWALGRLQLDFSETTSFEAFLAAIAARAAGTPGNQWILGHGFNESDWPENRLPLRADLDAVAPDNPTLIWRCDLHLAVANSRALELAGITADTPSPPEGVIEKDPDKRPTGILRELAINLVKTQLGRPTVGAAADALTRAIADAHALGLTGVHDIRLMGGDEGAHALQAWQLCHVRGDLALRTWVTLPGERLEEAIALGLRTGYGDELLRIGHLKFFGDGGMGARTAWMIEPFLDAGRGMPLISFSTLEKAVKKAETAGLAVMVHAVGDRASQELAGLFERVQRSSIQTTGDPSARPTIPHRIEHLQMVLPDVIRRLGKLNVAGTAVPPNLPLDINMIDQCLGARGRHTYAFRDLIDGGIPLALTSDCPVSDPNPLVGIHAAVTRCREDGTPRDGWYPKQRLTVAQAVRGYTLTPAVISGVEDCLGSLAPGKKADIIFLDRNIYTLPPPDILKARVAMTVFNGHVVYDALAGQTDR
jgi:predicted amidohydrolase YtcJ